jgi:SAM-dependent methyltransferase
MRNIRDQRLAEAQHVYSYMPSDHEIARLTPEALARRVRSDTWDGFEWLGVGKGSRVLELGCGGSYLAPLLAMREVEVFGCDISRRGVEAARRMACQVARDLCPAFVLGDATNLPFPDATFDAAYGSGVLHHLSLEAARGEILRVLKPGANAFFVEPLIHNPFLRLYRRFNRRKYTPGERPLSFQDVDEWSAGFSCSSHREYQFVSIVAHIVGDKVPRAVVRWLEAADSLLNHGPKLVRKQFRYVMIRLTR